MFTISQSMNKENGKMKLQKLSLRAIITRSLAKALNSFFSTTVVALVARNFKGALLLEKGIIR